MKFCFEYFCIERTKKSYESLQQLQSIRSNEYCYRFPQKSYLILSTKLIIHETKNKSIFPYFSSIKQSNKTLILYKICNIYHFLKFERNFNLQTFLKVF